MRVTILGAGAYGLALSKVFYRNGNDTTIWTVLKEEEEEMNTTRMNKRYLPDYHIDSGIRITSDMQLAIMNADLIVVAIPVKYIADVILKVKEYYNGCHICIASKGILQDKYVFPYTIVSKMLKTNKVGIISGGTFALDIINDEPIGLTIASKSKQTIKIIKTAILHELLRVDVSHDVIGAEMWGAIKNIVAIGCGIIYGLGYLESSRTMFFTKCYKDITNLIYEFKGNKGTAKLYAGIGDLFLTCTSTKSRNYTLGVMLGRNAPSELLEKYINETTIEGYYTLKSFYELIHKKKIKSELIDCLYAILYEGKDVKIILDYLNN